MGMLSRNAKALLSRDHVHVPGNALTNLASGKLLAALHTYVQHNHVHMSSTRHTHHWTAIMQSVEMGSSSTVMLLCKLSLMSW